MICKSHISLALLVDIKFVSTGCRKRDQECHSVHLCSLPHCMALQPSVTAICIASCNYKSLKYVIPFINQIYYYLYSPKPLPPLPFLAYGLKLNPLL